MNNITIDHERMIFTRSGKPFFYLADTAWMAFSNLSVDDWKLYLEYRKMQGFTAVQICVLPVLNDISTGKDSIMPFARDERGNMDFGSPNQNYFDKAGAMVRIACEKGLVPALVPLWSNYIPTSWSSQRIGNNSEMGEDFLEKYAAFITGIFGKFNPIYILGGDTGLETETVIRYYSKLLDFIKKMNPQSLTTLHPNPSAEIPESLRKNKNLDFYMYQSGHGRKENNMSWAYAEKYSAFPEKRPVVNGEPCYEGSCFGFESQRFRASDVRRAIWQSLLSGAKAGTAYGAHGIWMFQQEEMAFNNPSFSGFPYYWQDALRFKGAQDMGFIKQLFVKYDLFSTFPRQNLIEDIYRKVANEIRCAATNDLSTVAIYIPWSTPLKIALDLREYTSVLYLLDTGAVMEPRFSFGNGGSELGMLPFNEDALLIAEISR